MLRDLYRQSGLFRWGLFSLAGALAFAVLVVALVRPSGEQAVSAQTAAGTTIESSETTRSEARSEPIQSSPLPEETGQEQTGRAWLEEPAPRRTSPSAPKK